MITSQGIHHIRQIQESKNNKISQNITTERQQMAEDCNFARLAARPYWKRKQAMVKMSSFI